MVGDKIKKLRSIGNINQNDFANLISVSQQSISNWENGVTDPDAEVIVRIAKHFHVTTDYLLGLDGLQDDEYFRMYKEIHDNPNLKIFYDESKGLSMEDMKLVIEIVERIKAADKK